MRYSLSLALVLAALLLAGCGTKSSQQSGQSATQLTSEEQAMADAMGDQGEAYKEAMEQVKLLQLYLRQYQADPTYDHFKQMAEQCDRCTFSYEADGLTTEQQILCMNKKLQIDSITASARALVQAEVPTFRMTVVEQQDHLMQNGIESFPLYAEKGEMIYYTIRLQQKGTVRILNADSHETLRTVSLQRDGDGAYSRDDSLRVPNTAIYLIEVNPLKGKYMDLKASLSVRELSRLGEIRKVKTEQVEAKKGDFRATSVKGVKMQNLFEEPRKFTLRGQLKAMFSGSSRALVALKVPTGASDVMYSLRISTNEGNRTEDGQFYNGMCSSYHRVKFMGLPLYESQRGSGLLATLLGDNMPVREEDAYINMYVFYSAAQAKKFQDGTPVANLHYNVDYSTLGTQSCNGRIPAKGNKTIYLAFENERMRYNNYVWLEAISAVPTTEYYKTQYTLQ